MRNQKKTGLDIQDIGMKKINIEGQSDILFEEKNSKYSGLGTFNTLQNIERFPYCAKPVCYIQNGE